MSSWTLVPALVTLRNEFNTIAPNRDKSSDGSIGDDAHQQSTSDHNIDDGPDQGKTGSEDSDSKPEVHAIDVDEDLKEDFSMMDVVNYIISECKKSNDVGKDRGRLKYVIYERKIYEAPNWNAQTYSGSNPHDKHVHFSCEYDSEYSEDTRTWGLIERFGSPPPQEVEEDMGHVESFSDAAKHDLLIAATRGVLSYGAYYIDGVEENGITDLPGEEDTSVMRAIDFTCQTVLQMSQTMCTLQTALTDLTAKVDELLSKENPT